MLIKERKGFTLIELMIVVVIIGILAAISVPLYRGYVQKAMATEGVTLCGSIRSAERVYFAERGSYNFTNSWTAVRNSLGIDLPSGMYFNSTSPLSIIAGNGGFRATVGGISRAAGIQVRIDGNGYIQKNFGSGWVE